MKKNEIHAQLATARYKALDAYYTGSKAREQADRDIHAIDTAIDAIKSLVDAPEVKQESK